MKPLMEEEKKDERNLHWRELNDTGLIIDNERISERYSFDHVFDADK